MSFEGGTDARVLCQVHFRDICSLLGCQDTRVMSYLSLAHCNCSEGICRKSTVSRSIQVGFMCELSNQKGQQRITGLSLDSAATMELPGWRQCPLKAMALPPRVLLFAHCLGSWQEASLQLTSPQILLCVCPPPPSQDRSFYKIL